MTTLTEYLNILLLVICTYVSGVMTLMEVLSCCDLYNTAKFHALVYYHAL